MHRLVDFHHTVVSRLEAQAVEKLNHLDLFHLTSDTDGAKVIIVFAYAFLSLRFHRPSVYCSISRHKL